MNKSYFDSRGKSHELIAVLTAISHVSAKMARNLELLAELRNSKKGNTTYVFVAVAEGRLFCGMRQSL